jgi:hypothetical protein
VIAAFPLALVEQHLEFDVLIGREDAAHPVEHQRAGETQLGARGLHPAHDLARGLLVGGAVGHHLRQLGLQPVEAGLLGAHRRPGRLVDRLDAVDLFGRQRQFAFEAVVLPPLEALGRRAGAQDAGADHRGGDNP